MKKLIVSAGLVALGTSGLHAAYAPGLTEQQSSKPWTVSASLRGFYDDNITTASAAAARQESFGFELAPKAELNLPLTQTLLQASYAYSLKYYADRQPHKADHTHEFNASMKHTFSERYKMNLTESFVSSQEPEILGVNLGAPQRSNADAIHNYATLDFSARV